MKQVKQILVAIDRSAMAEEVLKRALSVAKKKDALLMVFHVIEPPIISFLSYKPHDEKQIRQEITEQINKLNKETKIPYSLFVEFGAAAVAIGLRAHKSQADLLIVGSHGKDDLGSGHFGSTVLKLVQRAKIPVLIVRNSVKGIYKRIVAPTNLSDYSKESIIFANTLFTKPSRKYIYAAETLSKLQAITYHISEDERYELQIKMAMDAKTALENFTHEVGGGEMTVIDYTASINEDLMKHIKRDSADLLVLGSRGVDNLNSFVFGSTASYLLQRSTIDLLIYVPVMEQKSSKVTSPEENSKQVCVSTYPTDLEYRRGEIREQLMSLFEENLKITTQNTTETANQKAAESLLTIFEDTLNELKSNANSKRGQRK